MTMNALENSWSADELEEELTALFIKLFEDELRPLADDINVYGAPHLGSFSLVERNIDQDGLAVQRETTEERIRYLFKAWRHRNPQRGLHFLRTYLTVIFGDRATANQLWQKKGEPYPEATYTADEIAARGESESDYYLTSRVRVDLDSDIVPDKLVRSLRSAVAARLLLNLRIGKFMAMTVGTASTFMPVTAMRLSGSLDDDPAIIGAADGLWQYANFTLPGDMNA